jgi:hypothetical protein
VNVERDPTADFIDDVVVVLDEVRLSTADVAGWMVEWRERYLPAALERGLRLRGIWRGASGEPTEVIVVICWSVDRVGRYWAARWIATEDRSVQEFWSDTDDTAIGRDRHVLQNISGA